MLLRAHPTGIPSSFMFFFVSYLHVLSQPMQSESVLICDDSCCSYAIKKKDEIERVAKANR